LGVNPSTLYRKLQRWQKATTAQDKPAISPKAANGKAARKGQGR
jgi:hypothetical protein